MMCVWHGMVIAWQVIAVCSSSDKTHKPYIAVCSSSDKTHKPYILAIPQQ